MVSNGRAGDARGQAGQPFQGRGFTAAERSRLRDRFVAEYGGTSPGLRALLRAFTVDPATRQLIVEASVPFTDPERFHRADRAGGKDVPGLYVEGFSAPERDRISRALLKVYRSEGQAVRSLALAYDASQEVRAAVQRCIPRRRLPAAVEG